MLRYLVFLAAAIAAHAQGTTPKSAAQEYPVHAASGLNQIGADYMVHSFSSGQRMYLAENFLVVEVALFPPKGEIVQVDAGQFALRVNGKKLALMAQNPAMVAANLKHRDWQTPRGPQADLGLGGINVGLGRPRTQAPFPGGPEQNRLPTPPRAPDGDVNTPPRQTLPPEEVLIQTALPEGSYKGPVAGFVYFAWQGKASTIKSLDLIYAGVPLKLR